MTKKNPQIINKFNLYFLSFFIFIWGSLDTNFENVINFLNDNSLRNSILFLRSTIPFFIFVFITFYLIRKNFNFKIFKENTYVNKMSFIFFIFLLIQLVSHFIAHNKLIFVYYFFLPTFLLTYLLTLFITTF